MIWTTIALAMTVLMGGIIAYNGDLIGRKFGKRRVSLFRLRPKHTAILITSVTGVLISLMTTVIMFLLLPPVRRVILEGEYAIRTLGKLHARADQLESEIAQKSDLVRTTQEEAARYQQEAKRQRALLRDATSQLAEVRTELGDARAELRNATSDRDAALDSKRRLEREITGLKRRQASLLTSNRKLVALNQSLNRTNARLTDETRALNARIGEQVAQIADQEKQIEASVARNAELSEQNEQSVRTNHRLGQEIAALQRVKDAYEQGNTELYNKNQALLEENRRLIGERTQLTSDFQKLVETSTEATEGLATVANRLAAVRTRRVVIRRGEEMARTTVPAGANPDEARRQIRELLSAVDVAARARGAAAPEADDTVAYRIARKVLVSQTPLGPREVSLETESEHITALTGSLSESNAAVCLIAVAVANTVEAEPAIIEIRPVMNPLIYTRGRVVASRTINTLQPPEKLFLELVEFLKDVGKTAIERGVIPHMDSASGEPQVGAVDWPELVRVVEQARSRGRFVPNRRVSVVAVAAEDIFAAGPLKLDFKIEHSPAGLSKTSSAR